METRRSCLSRGSSNDASTNFATFSSLLQVSDADSEAEPDGAAAAVDAGGIVSNILPL